MKNFLIVSETFYSIQGEGPSAGHPAVFLRLAGCNLRCRGFSYVHLETGKHLGCDTAHVWKQGEKISCEDLLVHWQQQGWLEKLAQGAHLVITGGEPTLHQSVLLDFIGQLDRITPTPVYIEVETNATQPWLAAFIARIQQINASPKLAHSGEPAEKAYRPEVLRALAANPTAKFKFVIADETDIAEILQKYVEPFAISPARIWLMPEGGTLEILRARMPMVVELCKKYNMHFSPRLQVIIWGEVTGV